MGEGRDQRRLPAVLAADVVGYTKLMEADTDGTVAAWKVARSDIIDPTIAEHSGRIVKHTGDGFLAEFSTVLDAVQCAVAMQQELTNGPLDFRMGANMGDIIDDGEDIHGEGVNIAARIEALADPGGICISRSVHEQVRNRLDHPFADMGEHEVKHVSAPVHVFRVVIDGVTPAKAETTELSWPDKLSIAVLPFDNMSGDPEQEYFSDGMTEDIITALSRLRWLFVIARNSTFTYKGQAVDIKQVGREMGVKYVLEGSVRKSGARVRVTAQLIEAGTGNHIWAERYDRDLVDIFDLQDDLTQAICAQVDAELAGSERQQAHKKTTPDLGAWELYQRGTWHHYKFTKEDAAEARRLYQLAAERAPEFAIAFAGLAVIA